MSTRSGHRLLGLVNELLDISKMEAGEMKVRRETVQVHVVVSSAIDQVFRVDGADNARIERHVTDDLPLMQADEDLLIRVLINLLGNALKFTPGNSKVTIAAREARTDEPAIQAALRNTSKYQLSIGGAKPTDEASQKDAPVILFSIQDQGEGIPEADQNRIFEKFGQVESRQEGHKMSTGLGLTFCKLAIEAHGGHIWVHSEIGKGSTFFFTVPLRPWVATDDKIEPAQAAGL
jgi:signal transduction histidine kinase